MNLNDYQKELRQSYVGGGPGAIVSAVVWFTAAAVSTFSSVSAGFAVLFFGGMLIFPLSKLLVGLIFGRSPESKDNPGGLIVVETVFPMIGCLFAAWLILPHKPEFVFPIASIAVGAHYYGFRTAYGDWTYWVLATALCLIGTLAIIIRMPSPAQVPYLIATTELFFGAWFILVDQKAKKGEIQGDTH